MSTLHATIDTVLGASMPSLLIIRVLPAETAQRMDRASRVPRHLLLLLLCTLLLSIELCSAGHTQTVGRDFFSGIESAPAGQHRTLLSYNVVPTQGGSQIGAAGSETPTVGGTQNWVGPT